MTSTIEKHEFLCDYHDAAQSMGVGDLRSEVRNRGIKGTWVAFASKIECTYVIFCYDNVVGGYMTTIKDPEFSTAYMESLELSIEHRITKTKEKTQEPVMTESTPQQAQLADQIAQLLTAQQAQPAPQIDEAMVRELVSQEVAKLTPRKLEVTGHGIEPKVIEQQHQNFEKLLQVLASGGNAFLVGEAGSGKTTGIFEVAKALSREFALIACNEMTDKLDFVGYMDANGNYVAGPAYKVYKEGGVLGIDELEKGGANAMTALNALLANNMYQFPNGEVVEKHENFSAIACGNTFGRGASRQYVGANQLDASTLDRFDVLEWDIDDKFEMELATDKEFCQMVQALREAVRSFEGTIQLIVSMRATLRGERLLASGFGHKEIFEMLVYKGIDAASKEKIAEKAAEIMSSRI